jgi:hypothetical protein
VGENEKPVVVGVTLDYNYGSHVAAALVVLSKDTFAGRKTVTLKGAAFLAPGDTPTMRRGGFEAVMHAVKDEPFNVIMEVLRYCVDGNAFTVQGDFEHTLQSAERRLESVANQVLRIKYGLGEKTPRAYGVRIEHPPIEVDEPEVEVEEFEVEPIPESAGEAAFKEAYRTNCMNLIRALAFEYKKPCCGGALGPDGPGQFEMLPEKGD